jgi:hypothetical protein
LDSNSARRPFSLYLTHSTTTALSEGRRKAYVMLGGLGLEKLGNGFGHNFLAPLPNRSKFFIAELNRIRAFEWYNICPGYFHVEGVKRESRTIFEKSLTFFRRPTAPGVKNRPRDPGLIRRGNVRTNRLPNLSRRKNLIGKSFGDAESEKGKNSALYRLLDLEKV